MAGLFPRYARRNRYIPNQISVPVSELYGKLFRINCLQLQRQEQTDILEKYIEESLKNNGLPTYSVKRAVGMKIEEFIGSSGIGVEAYPPTFPYAA